MRFIERVSEIREKVMSRGQGHVFRFWENLDDISRDRLLGQLSRIDFGLLDRLATRALEPASTVSPGEVEPVSAVPLPRTPEEKARREQARRIGEKAIRDGRVAAFLVAGGQGTRLGFEGPKGTFPVGPITERTLFQWHAEKLMAAMEEYRVEIPWYIMTSEANDADTRAFFQEKGYFGLNPDAVRFFSQNMIPAVDERGKLILDRKDHVFTSPNGHGGSLEALAQSGALEDMKKRKKDILSYFQVDNTLIRVVDPVFIGYHLQEKAEMSSKMVMKRHPGEKVGAFGRIGGRLHVIEYSDLTEEQKAATGPDGKLLFGAGSIAIHLIGTDFIEDETRGGLRLPYHVAHKKIPYLDAEGNPVEPERPNGYKFETFVFDALADTSRSVIMEVVREEEFSPIKNAEGEDSPRTARRDLTNYFGTWLEAAAIPVDRDEEGNVRGRIEISPRFARTEEIFLKRVPDMLHFSGDLLLEPDP